MCGICGVVGADGAIAEKRVRVMTDALIRRGPDDKGMLARPGVILGVRRLSIIDLPGGHQPIYNETAEVGVVFTDIHGKGSFKVVIGPVASGTYELEFFARNGAGCDVAGGGGNDVNHCEADFQSPGPFGTATTIVVP